MQPFNRTTEKVLAWIANVLLFFITGILAFIIFTGLGDDIGKSPAFVEGFLRGARQGATEADAQMALNIVLKIVFGVYLIMSILALVATLIMKSRIVSGVLFVLSAIAVALFSGFVFFPIYIMYLIVGIMLFVRKEPQQLPFNPYTGSGGYSYDNQQNAQINNQNQETFNQNVDGTNYQTTNTQNNNEEKVDKIEYL